VKVSAVSRLRCSDRRRGRRCDDGGRERAGGPIEAEAEREPV